MNDNKSDMNNDSNDSSLKTWFEDNLRVLLSILIVIAIAGGIYSYSKRSQQAPTVTEVQTESQDSLLEKIESDQSGQNIDIAQDKVKETPQNNQNNPATKTDTQDKTVTPEKTEKIAEPQKTVTPEKTAVPEKQVSSENIETSKETGESFIESAKSGDGVTHLARRAAANYLEKNPDSALSVEHKIYIEDYLRKHVSQKSHLAPGQSVEFSKDLIHSAIEKSKTLNEKQLNNLKKYAVRVPSLK